jgi:hypothetical protein
VLPHKSPTGRFVPNQSSVNNLQRHSTSQIDIDGLVGHSHSTTAQLKRRSIFPSDDLVMVELERRQRRLGSTFNSTVSCPSSRAPARRKQGTLRCRPPIAYRTPGRLVWLGLSPPYAPCCENVTPFCRQCLTKKNGRQRSGIVPRRATSTGGIKTGVEFPNRDVVPFCKSAKARFGR